MTDDRRQTDNDYPSSVIRPPSPERAARRRRRRSALVDRHAVSQLRRHQRRRRRLRHAAGARLRRSETRARRSIRGLIRSTGICIAAKSAISASSSTAAPRRLEPLPGDVTVFRYGRCYSHGGIVTAAAPLRIVHAFYQTRMVIEDDVSRNAVLADPARKPRFFSLWAKQPAATRNHERRLMSIFRSGNKQQAITPDYTGLQIQTAVNALPIPIVWGMSASSRRMSSGTTISAHPARGSSGGGKGLFNCGNGNSPANTTTPPTSSWRCAKGRSSASIRFWRGQSTYSLVAPRACAVLRHDAADVWPYLAMPSRASGVSTVVGYPARRSVLRRRGRLYWARRRSPIRAPPMSPAANYDLLRQRDARQSQFRGRGLPFRHRLGQPSTRQSGHRREFRRRRSGAGRQRFSHQCTVRRRLSRRPAIDTTSLFGAGGDASYQTYCRAVGLALSPALTDAETASSILTAGCN